MTTQPFGRKKAVMAVLSNTDVAILQTLKFQKKLDSGVPLTPADFLLIPHQALRPIRPSMNPPSEKMMASGPCRLLVWGAPGDGSYTTTGVPMVMTGVANRQGTAMMAGAAAATIGMNLMSSSRARRDAQPRWIDNAHQGTLTVSTHGFYVEDYNSGLRQWNWDCIQSIEWQGTSTVDLMIQTQSWAGRVRLVSDWAELVLVTWIAAAFPQHPGKYTWPTQEWAERVRSSLRYDPFTEQPV